MFIIVVIAIFGGIATFRRLRIERGATAAQRARLKSGVPLLDDNVRVTVRGTVRTIGPLAAPLSGRACVAYRAVVRTYGPQSVRAGAINRKIDEEHIEMAMQPFMLVTKQGDVLIDAETCELPVRFAPIIPRRLERERSFMVRMNAAGLVESNGFDELVVEENQKIVVHGLARIEAAPATETAYRENASRYRLTSGDGVISIDLA